MQQPYFVNGSQLLTDFSVEGSGVHMWGRLRPGLSPMSPRRNCARWRRSCASSIPTTSGRTKACRVSPVASKEPDVEQARNGSGESQRDVPRFRLTASAADSRGGLRQSRQPAAGARRGPPAGNDDSRGGRRGSGRLIRQLFTESLLLALLGSMAGLALGYVVLRSVMELTGAPAWLNPTPDRRVVPRSPSPWIRSRDPVRPHAGLPGARQRHRATLTRQILVGAQVAASCVLLIVAGLLARASNTHVTHPGFDYEQSFR